MMGHTYDLKDLVEDCSFSGSSFRWDKEGCFLLRCELDAAYFHRYSIAHDAVNSVVETFPIVKRKDEAWFGAYHTKRVVLEIRDAMQRLSILASAIVRLWTTIRH